MKKSKRNELRTKDIEQLLQHIKEARAKQAQLRFDIKAGKTAARAEERALRREIAVALTLIKEKEINHHE